jgi:agmatine deiminase
VTRAEIEAVLRAALGVERFVWLADGIAEDDETDGHVDNVVTFVAPGRAVLQGCNDPANPNHTIATDSRDRMVAAGIAVVDVPTLPYVDIAGEHVPVPYVNWYVANGVVVVPVTGAAADAAALELIGAQYPGRAVVAVDGSVLAYGGGGVHCITQPVPVSR